MAAEVEAHAALRRESLEGVERGVAGLRRAAGEMDEGGDGQCGVVGHWVFDAVYDAAFCGALVGVAVALAGLLHEADACELVARCAAWPTMFEGTSAYSVVQMAGFSLRCAEECCAALPR